MKEEGRFWSVNKKAEGKRKRRAFAGQLINFSAALKLVSRVGVKV